MLERQREGIAKAKAAGKYKGRPISIGRPAGSAARCSSGMRSRRRNSRRLCEEIVVVRHEPDQHHHRDKQKVHPRLRGRGGRGTQVMVRPAAQGVQRYLLMISRR